MKSITPKTLVSLYALAGVMLLDQIAFGQQCSNPRFRRNAGDRDWAAYYLKVSPDVRWERVYVGLPFDPTHLWLAVGKTGPFGRPRRIGVLDH